MRILVAAVGRARRGPEQALWEHYAGRIAWPLTLREVEERRPLPPDALKAREAELLLAAVPDGARTVALDERGDTPASEDLAARLAAWRDEGVPAVAFLIGGAEGLDRAVLDRADYILSFGRLTWPHLLVRGMLAEQVYRAQAILAGHPYHRR